MGLSAAPLSIALVGPKDELDNLTLNALTLNACGSTN